MLLVNTAVIWDQANNLSCTCKRLAAEHDELTRLASELGDGFPDTVRSAVTSLARTVYSQARRSAALARASELIAERYTVCCRHTEANAEEGQLRIMRPSFHRLEFDSEAGRYIEDIRII